VPSRKVSQGARPVEPIGPPRKHQATRLSFRPSHANGRPSTRASSRWICGLLAKITLVAMMVVIRRGGCWPAAKHFCTISWEAPTSSEAICRGRPPRFLQLEPSADLSGLRAAYHELAKWWKMRLLSPRIRAAHSNIVLYLVCLGRRTYPAMAIFAAHPDSWTKTASASFDLAGA